MFSKSKAHLNSVGESYFEHQFFALKYAGQCFLAGGMAIAHALVPAVFETGASDKVKKLAGIKTTEDREDTL